MGSRSEHHHKTIYGPTFSCYPSGTIPSRTKPICSKRMRRLISIGVNDTCMFTHSYSRTFSVFPCGKTQHVRRMHSNNVNMIQCVLAFRFMLTKTENQSGLNWRKPANHTRHQNRKTPVFKRTAKWNQKFAKSAKPKIQTSLYLLHN